MSTYLRPLTANFGPLRAGLVGQIGYKVMSANGLTTLIAHTTSGITEIALGTGNYKTDPVEFDTAWSFVVVFWDGPGGISVSDVINAADVNYNSSGGGGGGTTTGTFDPALSTQKDWVRDRVGDINGNPQWFIADETINAKLAELGYDETCAQCAESIGAQCMQLADSVEQRNLKLSYRDRARQAFELADRIRNLSQPGPGDPPNRGAAAGLLGGPDMSGYMKMSGLPACDPNRLGY